MGLFRTFQIVPEAEQVMFLLSGSGFLQKLQPRDQVMADRGFKIQGTLAFCQYTLAISPSKHTNIQMTAKNI